MSEDVAEIGYTISWRSSGVRLGPHKSMLSGRNGIFRDLVPLLQLPDPRRIALRASLSDPFERLLVRRAEQLSAIDVCVLVDVSTSMSFKGRCRKLELASDIATAIATCAERTGDSFTLLPFDSATRQDLFLHKSRSRAAHQDAIERLRNFKPERPGVSGIVEVGGLIAGARKLVLLISDFLWSAEDACKATEALAAHDVVPIEIDDGMQLRELPRWGLLNLRDLETGRRRLVVMRPAFKEQLREKDRHRRADILREFGAATREMLTIRDSIDWMRLTSYLIYGTA